MFIELKSQILQLSSSEMQIGQVYGETFEERLTKSNMFLKHELERLKDENLKHRDQIYELNLSLVQAHRDTQNLINELHASRESNMRLNEMNRTLTTDVNRLNETNRNLMIDINRLNETNRNLSTDLQTTRGDVNRLNHNLSSFTPINANTHSIEFILRLYISDRHPRRSIIRE